MHKTMSIQSSGAIFLPKGIPERPCMRASCVADIATNSMQV